MSWNSTAKSPLSIEPEIDLITVNRSSLWTVATYISDIQRFSRLTSRIYLTSIPIRSSAEFFFVADVSTTVL